MKKIFATSAAMVAIAISLSGCYIGHRGGYGNGYNRPPPPPAYTHPAY